MGRKKKQVSSADLKEQGNRAYANREFAKALDFYNKAIAIDPKNAVLFSNRDLHGRLSGFDRTSLVRGRACCY